MARKRAKILQLVNNCVTKKDDPVQPKQERRARLIQRYVDAKIKRFLALIATEASLLFAQALEYMDDDELKAAVKAAEDVALLCAECDQPMTVDQNNVTHHLVIGKSKIDHDQDADHVAVPPDDEPEPKFNGTQGDDPTPGCGCGKDCDRCPGDPCPLEELKSLATRRQLSMVRLRKAKNFVDLGGATKLEDAIEHLWKKYGFSKTWRVLSWFDAAVDLRGFNNRVT